MGTRRARPRLVEDRGRADGCDDGTPGRANAFVRYAAARALGALGDRRAIPALAALRGDTVRPEERDAQSLVMRHAADRVCDQARRALQKLKG